MSIYNPFRGQWMDVGSVGNTDGQGETRTEVAGWPPNPWRLASGGGVTEREVAMGGARRGGRVSTPEPEPVEKPGQTLGNVAASFARGLGGVVEQEIKGMEVFGTAAYNAGAYSVPNIGGMAMMPVKPDTARALRENPLVPGEGPLWAAADGLRRKMEKALPRDEERSSLFTTKVAEALGNTVALVGQGVLTGGMSAAGSGALAGLGRGYEEAKRHGADDEDALLAAALTGAIGTTEAVPVGKWVGKIMGAGGGKFVRRALETGAETVEEGLQEFFDSAAGNAVAKAIYDEDREVFEGAGEAAGVGAASGFIMAALVNALPGRAGKTRSGRDANGQTGTGVDAGGAVAAGAQAVQAPAADAAPGPAVQADASPLAAVNAAVQAGQAPLPAGAVVQDAPGGPVVVRPTAAQLSELEQALKARQMGLAETDAEAAAARVAAESADGSVQAGAATEGTPAVVAPVDGAVPAAAVVAAVASPANASRVAAVNADLDAVESTERAESEPVDRPVPERAEVEAGLEMMVDPIADAANKAPELAKRGALDRRQDGRIKKSGIEGRLAPQLKRLAAAGVEVQVVAAPEDIADEGLRGAVMQRGADAVYGVYADSGDGPGRVVLVASNLRGVEHARKVLAHEVLGHAGVRGVLGDKRMEVMAEMWKRHGVSKLGEQVVAAEPELAKRIARGEPEALAQAGEELVARAAEDPRADPALWRRTLGVVRGALGVDGDRKSETWLKDGDVRRLLRESAKRLKGRNTGGDAAGPGAGATQAMFSAGNATVDMLERSQLDTFNVRARQALADIYAPMERAEKLLGGSGRALDASVSAWKAMLMTRNLGQVVAQQMERGALDYNAEKGMFEVPADGRVGLRAVLAPVAATRESVEEFAGYARAMSARERALKLFPGKKWEQLTEEQVREKFGFGKAEADGWLERGRANPANAQAMDGYRAFMSNMRRMLVKTGMISQELADKLEQMQNYVPFHRDMADAYRDKLGLLGGGGGARARGGRGVADQGGVVQRARGSSRAHNPLLENMLAQVSYWTDAAMKNVAATRAVDILELVGEAKRVSDVKLLPVRVRTGEALRALKKAGANLESIDADGLGEALEMWSMSHPDAPNVISVSRKGKREHYEVRDPGMLLALKEMGPDRVDGIMKALKLMKDIKTRGVTSTPEFAVANLIRDTLATWVMYGKASDLGLGHMRGALKGVSDALRGGAAMRSMGASGAGGNMYRPTEPGRWDKEMLRKSVAQRVAMGPVETFKAWEKVLNAMENANRLAVREKVLREGGTEAEANFQAVDLLNFGMRGASGLARTLAQVVPFLNARVQGLYKLGRRTAEDPRGVLLRGGLLMGASLALWKHNRDDEDEDGRLWYRELRPEDKLLYYHFRIPGTNEIIRVPKPFEQGAMFSTLPEIIAEQLAGDEELGVGVDMLGGVLGDIFGLNPFSAPLTATAYEQASGKTMMFGSNIVPGDRTAMSPALQYRPDTKETTRRIGAAVGYSPAKIEAAVQSLVGGLGMYALAASDVVLATAAGDAELARRPLQLERMPVVGRFLRDSGTMTKRYQQEWYELREDVDRLWADLNEFQRMGDLDKVTQMMQDGEAKLSARAYVSAASQKLSAVNALIEKNLNDTDLPRAERAKVERDLLRRKNDVLRDAAKIRAAVERGVVDPATLAMASRNMLKMTPAERAMRREAAEVPGRYEAMMRRLDAVMGEAPEGGAGRGQ